MNVYKILFVFGASLFSGLATQTVLLFKFLSDATESQNSTLVSILSTGIAAVTTGLVTIFILYRKLNEKNSKDAAAAAERELKLITTHQDTVKNLNEESQKTVRALNEKHRDEVTKIYTEIVSYTNKQSMELTIVMQKNTTATQTSVEKMEEIADVIKDLSRDIQKSINK